VSAKGICHRAAAGQRLGHDKGPDAANLMVGQFQQPLKHCQGQVIVMVAAARDMLPFLQVIEGGPAACALLSPRSQTGFAPDLPQHCPPPLCCRDGGHRATLASCRLRQRFPFERIAARSCATNILT